MCELIGKEIEFKNAKRNELQIGRVIDKVLYKENKEDLSSVNGYLVKLAENNTVRVVKPIRVTRIIEDL